MSSPTTAQAETIDWPGLMRAGMTGLKLTPDAFWRLTPLELMLLLGREQGAGGLGRVRLEELARAYPDAAANSDKGTCDE